MLVGTIIRRDDRAAPEMLVTRPFGSLKEVLPGPRDGGVDDCWCVLYAEDVGVGDHGAPRKVQRVKVVEAQFLFCGVVAALIHGRGHVPGGT